MIAKKEMRNTGKSNVVGRISEEEIFLIDYIKPWQKFSFVEKGSIIYMGVEKEIKKKHK